MRKLIIAFGFVALSSSMALAQQSTVNVSDFMSAVLSAPVTCTNQMTNTAARFAVINGQRGVQVDNQNIYVTTNLAGVAVVSTVRPLVVTNTFRGTSLNALSDGYQVGDRIKTLQYYPTMAAGVPNIFTLNEVQVAALNDQGEATYNTLFNYQCSF